MSDAPTAGPGASAGLGTMLREAREAKGLDLGEVAGLTHVKREYLKAFEEGRYGDLPEDVYSRNFLRLFAKAVGVDENAALEAYRRERHGALQQEAAAERTPRERSRRRERVAGGAATAPAPAAGSPAAADSGPAAGGVQPAGTPPQRTSAPRRPLRVGGLVSTVLMVAAVVALALWGFNSTFFNPGRNVPQAQTTAAPQEAAEAAPDAAEPAGAPQTVRLSVSSDPPGAEVLVDEFPLPGTTPIELAPVTARPSRTIRVTLEGYSPAQGEFDLSFDRNLSFALTPLSAEEQQAQQPAGDGAQQPAAAAGAAPAGEAGAAAGASAPQAVLNITEDTWLEVYQGTNRNQGERLAFTTARSGQQLSFPLPIYIHVGNAGGVELTVDGQERGALGSTGEVRGLAVTR